MKGFACLVLILLAPAVAGAQTKCVDAKGKVTYQEGPCPGSQRPTLPPKPAAVQGPQRTEDAIWREVAELQRCRGDWEGVEEALQRSRDTAAKLRAEGDAEEAKREEDISRQHLNDSMERFLPACRRHGFEYPRDREVEKRNAATALVLGKQVDTLRAEADALARKAEQVRGGARATEEEQERLRIAQTKQCSDMLRQMGEARAGLRGLDAGERAAREREIAGVQAAYDKACKS